MKWNHLMFPRGLCTISINYTFILNNIIIIISQITSTRIEACTTLRIQRDVIKKLSNKKLHFFKHKQTTLTISKDTVLMSSGHCEGIIQQKKKKTKKTFYCKQMSIEKQLSNVLNLDGQMSAEVHTINMSISKQSSSFLSEGNKSVWGKKMFYFTEMFCKHRTNVSYLIDL